MKTRETRTVDVFRCDFCQTEVDKHYLTPCAICAREGCSAEGGSAHWSLSIENVYFYELRGGQTQGTHSGPLKICKQCAQTDVRIQSSTEEFFRYLATTKAVPHG